MNLHFGFPTANRKRQLTDTIAQLPETHSLIERWNDQWYVMGDRLTPFDPLPWEMIEKMLDLDPLPGFYCLRRVDRETNLWHLGETVEHINLWISSGAIVDPPAADQTDDPEALEAIDQMIRNHFGG